MLAAQPSYARRGYFRGDACRFRWGYSVKCGENFKVHGIVLLCMKPSFESHLIAISKSNAFASSNFLRCNEMATLSRGFDAVPYPELFLPLLVDFGGGGLGREGRFREQQTGLFGRQSFLKFLVRGTGEAGNARRSQMSTSTLLPDPPVRMHRSGHH
jgi:hypothetical protein